ncbi:peptidoglycan-binding protein [Frondihabitans cladoniiphilus]|uniref:Peptidoglycan binding-like domain-containing protein n=1 Tax=Frondihabitans cladoniiphilus TaxID=715785 RepID=A0ABP8VTC6_9MICO
MTSRRAWVVTACVAGVAVLATTGILVLGPLAPQPEADTAKSKVKTATATVDRGDLKGTKTEPGKLVRPAGPSVAGGIGGTLTELPAVGTVLKPRDTLYRVDNLPVAYFAGALPQWRPFEEGMAKGPDVQQLEQNLRDWGYLKVAADEKFDARTKTAVSAWQKDAGLERTGAVELGRIVFGEGDMVVQQVTATLGQASAPGTELYSTQRTEKLVRVDLSVGSPLATFGGVVDVELPNRKHVGGTVTGVGAPQVDEDSGKTTVPVSITMDDPAAAGDLSAGTTSVDFVSEEKKDVLSVPVTALGARAGGGFVVEVVGVAGATKPVTVTTGLFAGDRVEVTGEGLEAGQKVVVPA